MSAAFVPYRRCQTDCEMSATRRHGLAARRQDQENVHKRRHREDTKQRGRDHLQPSDALRVRLILDVEAHAVERCKLAPSVPRPFGPHQLTRMGRARSAPCAGSTSNSSTTRSDAGYGSGRNRTARTTLKTAALKPTPNYKGQQGAHRQHSACGAS